MALRVSVNGPDNVGKTTQISLLPQSWSVVAAGSLHEYDDDWMRMKNDGTFDVWWWISDASEFVESVVKAVRSRDQIVNNRPDLAAVIFDRGSHMFMAVMTAMIAMKHGHEDLDRARKELHSILEHLDVALPADDVKILLKHHDDMEESVKICLDREPLPINERYRCYQTLLHQEIRLQEQQSTYDHVCLDRGPDSHREIQDHIRAILAKYTLPTLFKPLLASVRVIFAIGGLSECGKSTIADQLAGRYSPRSSRLKIGYFLDEASELLRANVYGRSEKQQAHALLNRFEAYCRSHYWVNVITIESVHRFESLRWLKTWLGQTLQIVFVKTTEEIRLKRWHGEPSAMLAKDRIKESRGASKVSNIADLVLDNDGTLDQTKAALFKFADSKM